MTMAGDITSSFASGALGLTGDDLANNLRFESTGVPGEFLVTGLNDAATNMPTLIDGVASKVFSNVDSLSVVLNGGDDQVLCKNFTLQSLIIFGGAGDERIDIGEYVPLTTPNPSDNVQTIGSPQNIGALTIQTDFGAAVVRINYLYGSPAINIAHSAGNDPAPDVASLDLNIYVAFCSDLFIRSANASDVISVGYVACEGLNTTPNRTSGYCWIDTYNGDDLISVYCSSFKQLSNLPIYLSAGPGVKFHGGSGNDYIALDVNKVLNTSEIYGGEGSDTIQFSRNVGSVAGLPVIKLYGGAGDDTILVGKYYGIEAGQPVLLDSGSKFYNGLSIDMNEGNDTAIITANIIEYLAINMGTGDDYVFLGSNQITTANINGDVGYDRVRRYYNAISGTNQETAVESSTLGPPL